MLRLFATLVLLVAFGCEDDGPNSQHCIEVRMWWLELDHQRRSALLDNNIHAAEVRARLQDMVVNEDLKCFPNFELTTQ